MRSKSRQIGRKLCIFGTFALILAAMCACTPREKLPDGLNEFADSFRAANQAESIDPMLKLYNLRKADKRTIRLLKATLSNELGLPIMEIVFSPLTGAPEETICFEHDGVAYGPSHTPEYRMSVYHDSEDGFTSRYTIGRIKSGKWKILCSKPLPEPKL
ncbi:MAG: hypothetical protein AAF546_04110 [Verrucomicrobiota bacterium]